MAGTVFYRIPPALIAAALFALLLTAKEVVHRVRSKAASVPGGTEGSDDSFFLAAVLTMLSLFLGFTYAYSQATFEARRNLVIAEANAVGTAYLRAQSLPQPQADEIQELFRKYVALRAEIATLKEDSPGAIAGLDARSKELQNMIWTRAASLAREKPTVIVAIFLEAMNLVIDLHAERLAAYRFRVPWSIYIVLFAVSIAALGLTGHYFASRRRRGDVLTAVFAALLALVIWLILDLDNPAQGLITASQQGYIDLQKDIGPPAGLVPKLPGR